MKCVSISVPIVPTKWSGLERRLCLTSSTQHRTPFAGTYVKEFVHGDFGRTQPNLCQLMKQDVDILLLDVEEVELECHTEVSLVPRPIRG